MLADDVDPGLQRRAANEVQRVLVTKTLGNLLDGYVAHLRRLGRASANQVERALRPVGDDLRQLPASNVTKDDLMVPIRRLSNAAKKRAAGSLRSNLHAAFSLALVAADEAEASEDMLGFGIARNPVTDIRPIRGGQGYNSPGDRVIPAAVLLAYREKLDAMPPGDMKDALRLHLLTGNRVEQLLASTVEGDNLVLMDTKGRREQAPQAPCSLGRACRGDRRCTSGAGLPHHIRRRRQAPEEDERWLQHPGCPANNGDQLGTARLLAGRDRRVAVARHHNRGAEAPTTSATTTAPRRSPRSGLGRRG